MKWAYAPGWRGIDACDEYEDLHQETAELIEDGLNDASPMLLKQVRASLQPMCGFGLGKAQPIAPEVNDDVADRAIPISAMRRVRGLQPPHPEHRRRSRGSTAHGCRAPPPHLWFRNPMCFGHLCPSAQVRYRPLARCMGTHRGPPKREVSLSRPGSGVQPADRRRPRSRTLRLRLVRSPATTVAAGPPQPRIP